MKYLNIETNGEKLYDITDHVGSTLNEILPTPQASGIVHLFLTHTSCALCLSEGYAASARHDVEEFLKRIAPRNATYLQHVDEGADDSPSHQKSVLLHQNLAFIVEKGEMILGTWQSIYMAEFRDRPHRRKIALKFIEG